MQECLDKGPLRQIGRVGVIFKHSVCQVINRSLVSPDQCLKSCLLSPGIPIQ